MSDDPGFLNEQGAHYRRIELGMAVDGEVMTEGNAVQMASALASFAHFPWARLSWLGEGHTLSSAVAPIGFEGFLLSATLGDSFTLPPREGEKVTLLWATPVTAAEQEFVEQEPQGGLQLVERLTEAGCNPVFRARPELVDPPAG